MGKILLIDDNEVNLMLLEDVLALSDYQCSAYMNVIDGLSELRDNSYDLVLIDIEMPKINGIEGLKMIRALNRNAKVIAITANAVAEQVRGYSMLGFNDVITKPFKVNDVLSKVERYCIAI